jgi:hypothetical protein
MLWEEQLWQKSLPHQRQWWRRRQMVKDCPQAVQDLQVESGTQYVCCLGSMLGKLTRGAKGGR